MMMKKILNVEDRFLYFVKERESIRLLKESGKPKPWTEDKILQSYRFCNVRRMDDTVSKWLLENWYEPNFNHKHMLLACFMARLFNNPDSLEKIGFPKRGLQPGRLIKILHSRKREGLKNFNSAYIVSTNGLTGDKVEILVDRILKPVVKLGKIETTSLEGLNCLLTRLWGVSSFIGGQVSADARHAILGSWRDARVWAPMGPGSKRGLNRLRGRQLKAGVSQARWTREFAAVRKLVKEKLPKIYKRLEAIDIQNCLCEFDKYERTLWGEGRPKRKYLGV